MRHDLPVDGVYDRVVDDRLATLLERARSAGIEIGVRTLAKRDGRLLAREVAASLLEELDARLSEDSSTTTEQIALVNELLRFVEGRSEAATSRLLIPQVLERVGPAVAVLPPDLSDHGLLTGREGRESLLLQLKRELATCNRVDWLVSFIKLAAVKMLEADLEAFLARGGEARVVTTAYMGATDPKALDVLAAISQKHGRRLQIRFSQESDATRLHAKAYIHHRDSGFGTAYVGSANLSRPALTDGLEWTVRLSQAASPSLWSKIEETFEQWWGDPDFIEYGLEADHPSHAQFRSLVARERGSLVGANSEQVSTLPIFDFTPKPFQQEILDRIAVERTELGIDRHLIVAATGTGKTMIAAFDFRGYAARFAQQEGRMPRLLYIAHSERILRQARSTFGQVLRDLNFGGLLVSGEDDRDTDALFASIQSWSSRLGTAELAPDHFDYVVIDEVHHGEAPGWRRLLEWIRPRSLLGLTATPERADGLDITRHFYGRITAEVRLPDAIARRLLVPFHYFGVTDSIDFRSVDWTTRGYRGEQVERLYLEAGMSWIEGIRRALFAYVADPLCMRAIGFCSGVKHAEHMAAEFERFRAEAEVRGERAIRAAVLCGKSAAEVRDRVIGQLRRGELQIVFVADLLNEGVDIPEVDVVLFMRPTDSLTVYLQQLGRGLRLSAHSGKQSLTVLDFVGQHRKEFRFSERLGALFAQPVASMEREVEQGFSALPPGCSITLERIAQANVLENIRAQTRSMRDRMIEAVRLLRDQLDRLPELNEYLESTGSDPRVLYARGDVRCSWTALLAGARDAHANVGDGQARLDRIEPFLAGLRSIACTDDRRLAAHGIAMLDALEGGAELSQLAVDRRNSMLLVEFAAAIRNALRSEAHVGLSDALAFLRSNELLRSELRALLGALSRRATSLVPTSAVEIPAEVPLGLHRTYTRRQLFAAFGAQSIWRTMPQSGVAWIEEHQAYLMLVTLEKHANTFTERTRYRDYAISPDVFHWQSQATARQTTGDGRRIVEAREGKGTMWLFVRQATDDAFGTEPYVFMGAFRPTEVVGERPMSITGRLANPMPARWYEIAARAR